MGNNNHLLSLLCAPTSSSPLPHSHYYSSIMTISFVPNSCLALQARQRCSIHLVFARCTVNGIIMFEATQEQEAMVMANDLQKEGYIDVAVYRCLHNFV